MNAMETMIAARTQLIQENPFFGITSMKLKLIEDEGAKTMMTNGKVIRFAPSFVNKITLLEVKGVIAHEVMHCMLMHHTRRGLRDHKVFNNAGDYVINSELVKNGFSLPKGIRIDNQYNNMNTETVYDILNKEQQEQEQQQEQDQDQEGKGNNDDKQKQDDQEGKEGQRGEDKGGEPDPGNSEAQGNNQNDENRGDQPGGQSEGNGDQSGSEGGEGEGTGDSEGKGTGNGDTSSEEPGLKDEKGEGKGKGKGEIEAPEASQEVLEGENEAPGGESDEWEPGDPDIGKVEDYTGPEGEALTPSEKREEEEKWKLAITQAINQAEFWGNKVGNVKRIVKDIVDPPLDLQSILWRFFEYSAKNDYSWSPPHKNHIWKGMYLPSTTSESLRNIVIVNDTSSSVNDNQLTMAVSIINYLLTNFQCEEIVVIHADNRVQSVERLSSFDLPIELKPVGGGGTNFKPAFQWVLDEGIEPTCLIYITDLWCNSFPENPGYPVLWLTWGRESAPFGEVHKF